MIKNVIDMLAKCEMVGVTVTNDKVDCSMMINIDYYELAGNDFSFGDADQEISIKGIDRYEIVELINEVAFIDKENKSQITLYFIL